MDTSNPLLESDSLLIALLTPSINLPFTAMHAENSLKVTTNSSSHHVTEASTASIASSPELNANKT